jgi:hypothetical protein
VESKSFLSQQLDVRSTQVGERIGALASDLRLAGEQLRGYGIPGFAAAYANRGADLAERFGRYLEASDGDRLIADLEEYTRREPLIVAGAAAVAGIAASRFLKTSRSRRAL